MDAPTPGPTAPEAIEEITQVEPRDDPIPTEQPSLFIIDGHEDIAWNALEFNRDPLISALDTRLQEKDTHIPELIGERTTGLPDWLAGRIGILFATIFVMPVRWAYPGWNKMTYASAQEAHEKAKAQLDFYHALAESTPQLQVITSRTDLEAIVSNWQFGPLDAHRVGLILCMEGADPILSPEDLPGWFEAGLRIVGPAWAGTRYAGGTREPGPLTDLGHQLLDEMAALNMVLDLSHLAEEAFFEAVYEYPGPTIASHSNPRKYLPTERGLSNEMIRLLVAKDGVVGITLYNRYLKPGWVEGNAREEVSLDTVAEAIDYVAQISGSANHVAVGSDFDGGYGSGSIPFEMDTIADLVKISEALQRRGYSETDIASVVNGNWLRVMRSSLI